MIEAVYSPGSDRVFHFGGLYDVLPAQYLPLTQDGNEAAFFFDLFCRHGILQSRNGQCQPDGDLEYPCSFDGICFTMIDDVYNNFVHFEVDDPSRRKALAQKLKSLITEAAR